MTLRIWRIVSRAGAPDVVQPRAPNWSAKVEGLYDDLGRENYATRLSQFCNDPGRAGRGGVLASTVGVTFLGFTGAVARVGVNYHFNWGGALVAHY